MGIIIPASQDAEWITQEWEPPGAQFTSELPSSPPHGSAHMYVLQEPFRHGLILVPLWLYTARETPFIRSIGEDFSSPKWDFMLYKKIHLKELIASNREPLLRTFMDNLLLRKLKTQVFRLFDDQLEMKQL